MNLSFFFFQAEDGIRDLTVTGVQTCALPIYQLGGNFSFSDNDRPNLFVLSGLYRGPFGINVGALLRAYSGLPFSPTINSSADANGDGIRGNDRAYIPRDRNDITIDGNGGAAGVR